MENAMTNRRAKSSSKLNVPGRTPRPDINAPPLAFSIKEFCSRFRISEDFFFKMRREGRAPVCMKIGSRTLISVAAAERWCKERECETTVEQTRARKQGKTAATANA
jgi:hypothetical protein